VLGTPTEASWPGATLLPAYIAFEPRAPMNLSELFSRSRQPELDLLRGLLALDPARRPSAAQALQHPYFTSALPAPCSPADLPLPAGTVLKSKYMSSAAAGAAGTTGTGTGAGKGTGASAGSSIIDASTGTGTASTTANNGSQLELDHAVKRPRNV
jgi:serine/threonine protein kinase